MSDGYEKRPIEHKNDWNYFWHFITNWDKSNLCEQKFIERVPD